MKKAIALGLMVMGTVLFMGCQQQKPVVTPDVVKTTTPAASTQTTTATLTVTEPQTQDSKATLEILPSTEQGTTKTVTPTVPANDEVAP
jgi:hypothetical protein